MNTGVEVYGDSIPSWADALSQTLEVGEHMTDLLE